MIDTLPTTAAPAEPTTPIRPSEALRLGRLLRPRHTRYAPFDGDDGACAIGAMAAAVGIGPECLAPYPLTQDSFAGWPRRAKCPAGCEGRMSGFDTVWHLNDWHSWDDTQIVAWLESLGL